MRKYAAVLQGFRLMNKIWRDKGIKFQGYPVRALTYKCIAMGTDLRCLELIAGCQPLRLLVEIEENILISI